MLHRCDLLLQTSHVAVASWSVCLCVLAHTRVNCAKTAELMVSVFGEVSCGIRWGPNKSARMGTFEPGTPCTIDSSSLGILLVLNQHHAAVAAAQRLRLTSAFTSGQWWHDLRWRRGLLPDCFGRFVHFDGTRALKQKSTCRFGKFVQHGGTLYSSALTKVRFFHSKLISR